MNEILESKLGELIDALEDAWPDEREEVMSILRKRYPRRRMSLHEHYFYWSCIGLLLGVVLKITL